MYYRDGDRQIDKCQIVAFRSAKVALLSLSRFAERKATLSSRRPWAGPVSEQSAFDSRQLLSRGIVKQLPSNL